MDEMKQGGRGHKDEPTFVDLLEHIGSGGVSVDRSEARRWPSRERVTSSGHDDSDPRRPGPRGRRADDPYQR